MIFDRQGKWIKKEYDQPNHSCKKPSLERTRKGTGSIWQCKKCQQRWILDTRRYAREESRDFRIGKNSKWGWTEFIEKQAPQGGTQ